MSVPLRHVLRRYRSFIAIYLVLLAWGLWMGGMVDAWDSSVSDRARFLAPLGAIGGFMMLCCAWGAGYGLGDGDLKGLAKSNLRPWAGATVGLTLVTWMGFLFLLAWHDFPPDSLGQAARALIVFGTASALSFWWGLAARAFGSRWIWLLPLVLAVGWISGRVWGSLSLPEIIYQPVKNISLRHQAKAFLQTAHVPIALLGAMALAGCWWFRKFTINRFTPLFFTIPIFLISWLGVKVHQASGTVNLVIPPATPNAALLEFFGNGSVNRVGQPHTPNECSSSWASYLLTPPAELGNCVLGTIGNPKIGRVSLENSPIASSAVNLHIAWQNPTHASAPPQLTVVVSGPLSELKGTLRMEGILHIATREVCGRLPPLIGGQFQVRGYQVLVHPIEDRPLVGPEPNSQCFLSLEWERWQPLPMFHGNKDGWGNRPSLNSLDLTVWLQLEDELIQGTSPTSLVPWEQSYSLCKAHWKTGNFREFRFWPGDPQLKHAQLIVTHPIATLDIPFDWKFITTKEK